ncbi:MAG TPA: hypothetical protein VKP30_04375 [Polyangiaceae bacterium]|nr:hypothetical protein [Polyangiaceae bacterium]
MPRNAPKPRLSLSTTLTTLRLLQAMNSGKRGTRPDVIERAVPLMGSNAAATCFEPRRKLRGTLVLVHGVTGRANQDPLLVHLARSLAGIGYRSIVPGLEHLANFKHDPRDIDTIVAAIEAASHHTDRVSILAFSYGASYALCAAANPKVNTACSALVGFGAYFELSEALEFQRQLLLRHQSLDNDDADITYLRYTLLATHRQQLDLPDEAWRQIEPILVNFTTPRPLAEKRAPLVQFARHIDYVKLMESYQERPHAAALSPASSLHNVRCWVGLLHDPNDMFVPPDHAERIRAALDGRPNAEPVAVLTTPMLSHVQVDPLRRVLDLPRLIRVLEPVLGS